MSSLKSRERGFTLIELLVVTAVIATLMGITFRLAGAGGDTRAKSMTLSRLQRLENAISGYYAAYGSYPPVPLQGRSQDINTRVNEFGVQGSYQKVNLASDSDETKRQIDAACRAQPVAVLFPLFMEGLSKYDRERSRNAKLLINSIKKEKRNSGTSFDYLENANGFGNRLNVSSWRQIQLFQFGLLSFLLPRYLFMLQGDPLFYDGKPRGQWSANNQLPCRIDSGEPYSSWESMQEVLYDDSNSANKQMDASLIASLTSQAVCARWMPNLEGIISGGYEFFGVDTSDDDRTYLEGNFYDGLPGGRKWLRRFSKGGDYDSRNEPYLLNGMTVCDGWENEFYYYSEQPYQSYQLWSGGPNRRTFPPWIDENSFSGSDLNRIMTWTGDDVRSMGN